METNLVPLSVNRRIFSNSAKWPASTIRSASSSTRNLSVLISLARVSFCTRKQIRQRIEARHHAMLTSSKISHSRPGVATSTSMPLSKILRCFCDDIPPTMVATLTCGGLFFFCPASDPSGLAFSFPFLFLLPFEPSDPISGASSFTVSGSILFKQIFKCEETCNASSRVGARISARSFRRLSFAGHG